MACAQRHVPAAQGRFKVKVVSRGKILLQAEVSQPGYCTVTDRSVLCGSTTAKGTLLRSTCVRGCKRGALPVAVGSVITLKTPNGRYVSGKAGKLPRRAHRWERFLVVNAGAGFVGLKAGNQRCHDEEEEVGEPLGKEEGHAGAGWLMY